MWESWMDGLLAALALPEYGLSTVFVVALLSATLLPMGSEPAVFGLVQLNPALFWPTMAVATLGNTLGGVISWWMGGLAGRAVEQRMARKAPSESPPNPRALRWLQRFGPKACFLSFLPVVGDPLCVVAGWLRMPLGPCVLYMAVGKFLRYVVMTWLLMHAAHGGMQWWRAL
ncbi:membrane protein [Lampropedia cohaerens]|uniref:Membrane protein n=1 Tax=Lampropedia cohaerens TaxID=1610491 RepID=A0A0U1PYW3_9BURK|nr:YqaA family protein [Lampropedia cohaerens]KKW67712.1 membrane protein [Lampropedia cohaerens]